MNKVLPNILLIFALALCGLCTFQWLREGRLYKNIESLNSELYQKRESIQGLESTVKRFQTEITRLDGIKAELTATIVTNKQEIAALNKDIEKLLKESDAQKQQLTAYKEAMATANERITKQNEDITRQNESLKALAGQRDEKVAELVKLAENYNKVVKDFNELQEAVNKAAEAQAAQSSQSSPDQKKTDPKKAK